MPTKFEYKGEFHQGDYIKKGGEKIPHEKEITTTLGERKTYEGEWKNGLKQEQETLTYTNSMYNEEWVKVAVKEDLVNKKNKIPTLLVRFNKDKSKKKDLEYENFKFKKGGEKVTVKVVDDAKDILKALHNKVKKVKGTSFRLVIEQHGGKDGANQFDINENSAREILQKIVDKGITDIRISSLSCHEGEAKYFKQVAKEFNDRAKITLRSAIDGETSTKGYKVNKDNYDFKRFTIVTLDKVGKPNKRKKTVYEKQESQNKSLKKRESICETLS